MIPTIDEIRQTEEYTNYEMATLAYARAWRSGDMRQIETQTNWLILRYDQLDSRCQRYIHLVDTARREILGRTRQAIA